MFNFFILDDKSGVSVRSSNLKAIFGFDSDCKEEIKGNSGLSKSSNRQTTDRHGRNGGALYFPHDGGCRLNSNNN